MSHNKIKSKKELSNVNPEKVDVESFLKSVEEKKKALQNNNIIQK
jgi:hypothetical protein